ncbi:protein-disulfide isomerase [Actinomycetospora succinea]|uniref:Protein-disulfide isomerase n=1 Tax=Actinomycetospora succinea TaxID=663603 RepID=A0A4R6VRH6_9PSEU|nr:thioredoxin domain-containing protein [Actinomycetospora succinea]TDQ65164.1 protein-disulfide isomerase [Actinomycetospora succinea]
MSGAVLALLVLAVLAIVAVDSDATDGPPPGEVGAVGDPTAAARLAVARRTPGDPLALGRPDAPVVVSEWGDFQCPFCRLYATTTEPALLRQYVDSGQVRIEWHNFAYLGPESVLEARAARAAGRQGRFWDVHAALYRDQAPENRGEVTDASLVALAGRLGLDVPRFARDYADPRIARDVADDQQLGSRLGVGGVPSFVIGDRLIFGAQPLAAFQQAVDAALARSR